FGGIRSGGDTHERTADPERDEVPLPLAVAKPGEEAGARAAATDFRGMTQRAQKRLLQQQNYANRSAKGNGTSSPLHCSPKQQTTLWPEPAPPLIPLTADSEHPPPVVRAPS